MPQAQASSHALEELLAYFTKPREKLPSVCKLQILESSDSCSSKHGIVF